MGPVPGLLLGGLDSPEEVRGVAAEHVQVTSPHPLSLSTPEVLLRGPAL